MTGNRASDNLLRIPSGTEVSLSAPYGTKPHHFKAIKDGRELSTDELPAQRAAQGIQVQDFEFNLVFDDGTKREVVGHGTPLWDEEGRPRGAVHVLVDITERKRAEEELRESEARFRSVLDNSIDVIYRINVQTGHYEYVSPSAKTVAGYSPAEFMAMDAEKALAMIHPEDLPAMRETTARLEETGNGKAEYRQRAKNGDYRWISNHMSLTMDSAGQATIPERQHSRYNRAQRSRD
jgi:PAS domain S-box-containing protein